jgi:hypothetical protein
MQRDEGDVKQVMDVIANWKNPFESSEELVNQTIFFRLKRKEVLLFKNLLKIA